ncbi:beta-N-acetylhexosaminidase [Sulfuricystis multivorans]|uniref:beta-N-acetylhexosaminidase n=1 Tax=Sulfuricystis multivorans TaxID=2211108 RepID=UPI000F84712D|nr:beta-N-acetylhexosaminidase [Sulfuricystis multivorans]
MSHGPLMIDINGPALTDAERERLRHPLVGGVILFARNYRDPEQLAALCAEIHDLRTPRLLIAIDHEGGRVQRCREGFTAIPAMRRLGQWWDKAPQASVETARMLGFVLAAELRACGVDLSFTPVLDLDYGVSSVIGDRAFHRDPKAVSELAGGLIRGMKEAGMACCGKHFPGHGWVEADSHVALPVDGRRLEEMAEDLQPYRHLIAHAQLDAVMPAHVIYPRIDERPAGFSPLWIGKLRREFGFDGAIFSDDLSMAGASVAGDIVARVEAAWMAGCDMLLVCNAPEAVEEVLTRWQARADAQRAVRIARLLPTRPALSWGELAESMLWQAGRQVVRRLTGDLPAPGKA